MVEYVLLEDFKGHRYCCRRKDWDKLWKENREVAKCLAELTTIYISNDYIGFTSQLKVNMVGGE